MPSNAPLQSPKPLKVVFETDEGKLEAMAHFAEFRHLDGMSEEFEITLRLCDTQFVPLRRILNPLLVALQRTKGKPECPKFAETPAS